MALGEEWLWEKVAGGREQRDKDLVFMVLGCKIHTTARFVQWKEFGEHQKFMSTVVMSIVVMTTGGAV